MCNTQEKENAKVDRMTGWPGGQDSIVIEHSVSIYTIFRQYLIHEDDLVNQRTTWSLTIQAFIIVAFGVAFQNRMSIAHGQRSEHEYAFLIFALAILGLGVSLICLISVRAAQIAIQGLSEKWDQWGKTHLGSSDYYPPLTGGGKYWATRLGHALPIVLQGFFVGFWIAVIGLQISFSTGLLTITSGP
jgi:hypothetical protein